MTDDCSECFRILQLKPGASPDEVKRAYREMAKAWHPDQFADDSGLQNKARERLRDIDRAYDRLQEYFRSNGAEECGGPAVDAGLGERQDPGGGDIPLPIQSRRSRDLLLFTLTAIWRNLGGQGQGVLSLCGVLSLWFLCSIIAGIVFNARCCETVGMLGNTYTVVTSTSRPQYFKVRYVFRVNGVMYSGKGTMNSRPQGSVVQVFYDPLVPSWNDINRKNTDIGNGLAVFAILFVPCALMIWGAWPRP